MKRLDGPDGAKTFAGVLTDPTIQFFNLFLIQVNGAVICYLISKGNEMKLERRRRKKHCH